MANDDDWLATPPEPAPSTDATPTAGRRSVAVRAGLVVAGAVVGGIVVTSLHHDSTSSASPAAFPGQLPGGGTAQGVPPGGFARGFAGGAPPGVGGRDGEQRLSGTLVSIGSSTVTVKTPSGTSTYTVTSSSEIVRNGSAVALSALRAGDPVFVHVYPGSSGSRLTVERLFAGSTARP